MALEVPQMAEVLMLQYIVNMVGTDGQAPPSGGSRCLHLFTNNMTPSETTSLTDLAEAVTPTGYAPVTLPGVNWTTVITNSVATAVYSEQTFAFTTGVTLYGYYVTTTDVSPTLLWAERFTDAPWTLPSIGGEVGVSPQFTLD